MRKTPITIGALVMFGASLAWADHHETTETPKAAEKSAAEKGDAAMQEAAEKLWSARAVILNAAGENVGRADLVETPQGVKIKVEFRNMDPGVHAFHIHETGECEPPFKSAGGHFNPTDRGHGFLSADGRHLGDLPNLHIPESGALTLEVYAPNVTLNGPEHKLLDEDGSALVVHQKADDEKTDPAGAAGDRIACGVILPTGTVAEKGITAAPPI